MPTVLLVRPPAAGPCCSYRYSPSRVSSAIRDAAILGINSSAAKMMGKGWLIAQERTEDHCSPSCR